MVCRAVGLAGEHVGTRVSDRDSGAARQLARPDVAAVTVQAIFHAVGPHALTRVLVVVFADDAVSHGDSVGGSGDGDIDRLLACSCFVDAGLEVNIRSLEVTVAAEGGGDVRGDLAVETVVGDGALTDVLFVRAVEGGCLEGHRVHACGDLQALAQANREGRALSDLLTGVVHMELHQ